jgi:hypothetical protein
MPGQTGAARAMVTAWGTFGAIAAAAKLPVPTALATAATVRNRSRVGSRGGNIIGWSIADVFVGGVLSTLSAWVIGGLSLWLGLEPGRKFALPLGLLLWYHGFMAKTSVVPKKRRGPAPTGKGTQIGMRWQGPELTMIDDWAAAQSKPYTRSEAIRRLVELGLKAKR